MPVSLDRAEKQDAAIALLQKSLNGQLTSGDPDLNALDQISREENSVFRNGATAAGLGVRLNNQTVNASLPEFAASVLPKIITPALKENLRKLDAFAKAGENASPEQQLEAVEAYSEIGKGIKVAIAAALIHEGISQGMAQAPYIGPFAGVIADTASEPLARMAVEMSERSRGLTHTLMNKALIAMGKEPVSAEDQDLFMTKAVAKFAGGLLKQIESQEKKSMHADYTSGLIGASDNGAEWKRNTSEHREFIMQYLEDKYGFSSPGPQDKTLEERFGAKYSDYWSADTVAMTLGSYLEERAHK